MGLNGSRRPHIKSRNGCGQCKVRRIKCDELPPRCKNCQKRRLKCDYEEQFKITPSTTASELPEPTIQIRIDPLSTVALANRSTDAQHVLCRRPKPRDWSLKTLPGSPYSSNELELLHHYANTTSLTLSEDGKKRDIWRYAIPYHAQSFPALLENLMSLAALHLAYLRPSEQKRFTYLAAKHQEKCLQGAKNRKPGITEQNCSAVIVCSGLLLLHELAVLHPSYFSATRSRALLDEFLDKVSLMRRVLVMWQLGMPLFKTGPVRDLVLHNRQAAASSMIQGARTAIDHLLAINKEFTTDEKERNAYDETIGRVWDCYEEALSNPPDWFLTISWPLYVPELYMQMLNRKEPLALVIIAHFVALLSSPANRWWASGWPGPVLRAISMTLREPWGVLLEWPAKLARVDLQPSASAED